MAQKGGDDASKQSKRTGGVADYFTILGIGDDLVWKHTQKQREQEQQRRQQQQQQQSQEETHQNSDPDLDPNNEDQAALMERFYREIIDVTICVHKERNHPTTHHPPPPSSVLPASSIVLTSTPSIDTDVNSQQPSIMHSPSSHSEATTVATTVLSSDAAGGAARPTTIPPPSEMDGFTLFTKTNPPKRGTAWNNNNHPQPSPYPLGSAISASFSHGLETPTSLPWNHHQQHMNHSNNPYANHYNKDNNNNNNNNNQYVFDANLGAVNGLKETVCSTLLQWEESQSDLLHHNHHPHSSSASVGGSSAASLKGLRKKVESSWKRWNTNPSIHTKPRHHASTKFYLGYKRRTPDQDHAPAVADLQLFYARLPRETLTKPPSPNCTLIDPTTPPGSSAGLAGRVAAAAGHVLFRSQPEVETSESHHQQEDFQRVDLEEVLPVPEGFDRWSFPEALKVVYVPKPDVPKKPSDALRKKTVLLASPSHGAKRRPLSPPNSSSDDSNIPPCTTEQEAVEAYVQGSFSAPNSPNPQDTNANETKGEVTDNNDQMEEFIPKVFTDVPWEEDQDDPHQPHHPFFHAEDQWWYIPILALRFQRAGEEERYHEDPGIVDLAVSFCDKAGIAVLPQEQDEFSDDMMMEDDDEEFSLLSKTPWLLGTGGDNSMLNDGGPKGLAVGLVTKREMNKATKVVKKTLGSPAILLKRNIPIGFADLAFATSVLDRFPLKNYKGLPLPEEELPMFCYPTGCRLHRARFSDAPLPEYYGFVVKNERGDSIYVSCVSFMEPLTRHKIEQLSSMSEKRRRTSPAHRRYCEKRERRRKGRETHLYCSDDAEPIAAEGESEEQDAGQESSDDDDLSDNCILTSFDTMTTFENKTICLVSRYPFWTAFRRFLSHLHIMSGSSSDLPLERCISHLLLSVPVPKPGGPSVIVPLPALNQPMVMSLPPLKDFPLTDLPLQRLVACLDVSTIVTVVLGFLALERKVIVMSTRPSLVLDACELLRSLLFPFDLCAPYVPRLTEPFMSCLEFPGAIFVGIHNDGSEGGLAAVVRKNPPEDSIIVDLDSGSMDCTGNRFEVLTNAWEIMPKSARSMLVSELETLCRDADIVPGQEPLDSLVDSAFDAAMPTGLVEDFDVVPQNVSMEPLDDRAIRDAFLRFFCATLRGYERFLVVPDADFLISGNEWFDTQAFLASAPKENSAYLNSLVSTQLFQSFIQRRTEDSDVHCLLFDECLTEYHSATIPYGRLGGDVETIVSNDNSQPHMLYSLLVDQSAAAPYGGINTGNATNDQSHLVGEKNSADDGSRYAGDSDFDSSSYALGKTSMSATTDFSEGKLGGSDIASIKNTESALTATTATGDIITAPPKTGLPEGVQYIYCVDGNPCFPLHLDPRLFLPREPDSWLIELSKNAPNPALARSEREVEEANRRRRSATSSRGFHTQKRCLWQLPKLMGSHFLGAWLLCVPSQVAQKDLSNDQQSRYLVRALGALRLLRHKQRIIPDEAAYRALMVACGRTMSDRRVELVKLFGLLRSDGIFPTAVTLGQYTRALAEGYSKQSASGLPEDNVNDFGGVEVTESMVRGSSRSSLVGNNNSIGSAESALFALDGNLANLESAGKRWRQRSGGNADKAGNNASAGNKDAAAAAENERNNRKRFRSWLPVVVSSSFVPAGTTIRSAPNPHQSKNSYLRPDNATLIALWSRTCACDSCGYIPLEEEIQAGWDSVGDGDDSQAAVGCPRCGYAIIPMLGYREMSIEEALELKEPSPQNIHDADFAGLPPQVGPYIDPGKNKASFVTYISPATLRLTLERYIEEQGEDVLSRERLKQLDPEVFYNFFWYCARFNLPLPLPIDKDSEDAPKHLIAFAAWERTAAERGCYSGACAISCFVSQQGEGGKIHRLENAGAGAIDPFDEYPLLSRFNLQGFYPSVWDHRDTSEILVALVTTCDSDRRDFKVVVESVLKCNHRRRQQFGDGLETASDLYNAADHSSEGALSPSVELDCYKTLLFLAKYQCTTAFHTFFPAVAKPCKGSHFWCAVGTPLPIFDRLLREAVKKVNSRNNSFAPINEVSDVALGFRCVFGHLI